MPALKRENVFHVDSASPAKSAKVEIRRRVMEALGDDVHVFDAFAGSGEFYRLIWNEAASYVGCDKRYFPDDRRAFVADNRRVLRALDLGAFNLFDLDAYGSPWEQAIIIAARRPLKSGEVVGLVITEGNGLNYKNNVVPRAVSELTGLRHGVVVGLFRRRDEVHSGIIGALCRRMNATIIARWQAVGRTGAAVAYMGIVLRGI